MTRIGTTIGGNSILQEHEFFKVDLQAFEFPPTVYEFLSFFNFSLSVQRRIVQKQNVVGTFQIPCIAHLAIIMVENEKKNSILQTTIMLYSDNSRRLMSKVA